MTRERGDMRPRGASRGAVARPSALVSPFRRSAPAFTLMEGRPEAGQNVAVSVQRDADLAMFQPLVVRRNSLPEDHHHKHG